MQLLGVIMGSWDLLTGNRVYTSVYHGIPTKIPKDTKRYPKISKDIDKDICKDIDKYIYIKISQWSINLLLWKSLEDGKIGKPRRLSAAVLSYSTCELGWPRFETYGWGHHAVGLGKLRRQRLRIAGLGQGAQSNGLGVEKWRGETQSFCTFVLLDEQTETGRYMDRFWQIYSVAAWYCMQIDRNVAHVSIDKDQIHIVHCVHRA